MMTASVRELSAGAPSSRVLSKLTYAPRPFSSRTRARARGEQGNYVATSGIIFGDRRDVPPREDASARRGKILRVFNSKVTSARLAVDWRAIVVICVTGRPTERLKIIARDIKSSRSRAQSSFVSRIPDEI